MKCLYSNKLSQQLSELTRPKYSLRLHQLPYFCMLAMKAQRRLCRCAGLSEPWLLADSISSNILCAHPFVFSCSQNITIWDHGSTLITECSFKI